MIMIVFVVAAAASCAVLSKDDFGRYWPFWLPATLLFALSVGREPSVVFLGLFLLPTIVMGVGALLRRISPIPFLLIVLSDVAVGIALSLYQSKTSLWSLPPVGGWGAGAGALVAVAAVLRLGTASDVVDSREGGLLPMAWWQGVMLAYWAGTEAAVVLVVGGAALWATGAYLARSNLAALSLAGGTVAVAAALEPGILPVLVIGLAGTGLAMGERVAAPWAIAILPLSFISGAIELPTGLYLALPALLFPPAWALMTARVSRIRPPRDAKLVVGPTSGLLVLAYLVAVGASFVDVDLGSNSVQIPAEALNALWLCYGLGVAASVAYWIVGDDVPGKLPPERPSHFSQFHDLVNRLIPAVAWGIFGVAMIIAVRLLLAGLRTGFL